MNSMAIRTLARRECKDQKCLVPHCVSSRYVLSHYHRCKDVRCPVCGPVREAIHRSHEKQKQMQAMKQQGQPVANYSKQGSTQKKQGSATKRRKTASGMVPGAVPSQQGGYNRPPNHQPHRNMATIEECLRNRELVGLVALRGLDWRTRMDKSSLRGTVGQSLRKIIH